jgi:hypothetical protein
VRLLAVALSLSSRRECHFHSSPYSAETASEYRPDIERTEEPPGALRRSVSVSDRKWWPGRLAAGVPVK